MQSDAEFERACATYVDDFGIHLRPPRWLHHCPRCQRGLTTLKLLSRPLSRTDGPMVCGICVRDEQRIDQTDERRREAREHGRKQ